MARQSFTLTIRQHPDGAGLRLTPVWSPKLTERRQQEIADGAELTPIEGAGLAALGAAGAFLDGLVTPAGDEYRQREG